MHEHLYWGMKTASGDSHPDDLLYHYTTAEGLIGIVTSEELWATSIHHLNDSHEYLYAVELLDYQVRQWGNDQCTSQVELDLLKDLSGSARAMDRVHVHVFSLSENHDQLSQWRSYAPDGGYAVAFDRNQLVPSAAEQGFTFQQCVYDAKEQTRLLRALLGEVLQHHRAGTAVAGPNAPKDPDTWLTKFDEWFLPLAARFKHPSFHEEAEWRLISDLTAADDALSGEHTKGCLIVPHLRIKLPDIWPINGVTVSPMPHQRLAVDGVFRLFQGRDRQVGGVSRSRIPFRSL